MNRHESELFKTTQTNVNNSGLLFIDNSKNLNSSTCNFLDSVKQQHQQQQQKQKCVQRSMNDVQSQVNPNINPVHRIGKYKIIRTIGQGNFAKVKLAIHLLTGREVAIKMIDKIKMFKNYRDKLLREVKVIKSINHPNIVQLYEVIETGKHVYLVMEYAKNGEMYDYLVKNGRMTEAGARSKFRQILSAVQYCHRKHIVHRDMKAENLLLDAQNDIKLADFGFANNFDPSSLLDTFCGSPPYAAPELLNGEKYTGPEVDIWALGVILYLLVSGSLPFEATDLKELHRRITQCDYRVPYFMSTKCEKILKRMLVIDPKKRSCLEELMKDPWINIGYESEPLKPYNENLESYNDPLRIALMNELGFAAEDLRETFERHLFNNIRATYLLLADKETQYKIAEKLISIISMLPINTTCKENDFKTTGVKSIQETVSQPPNSEIHESQKCKSESNACDNIASMTVSKLDDKCQSVDESIPSPRNNLIIVSDEYLREIECKSLSDPSSCHLDNNEQTFRQGIRNNQCKISNNLRRVHATSLYENTNVHEYDKVIVCNNKSGKNTSLRDEEFVNQCKSINSFLHNGLRRHFIIDRAQTAIPDSSECRVKQNFIQTKDQSCDWENLPYDQSGRATVPVIIYHDECQYFNEISNHQNDTNNIVNNNNNNSDNNEKGMTKNFRLQKVKYQRNNSNPTEVQSAVHSSDQQQQQSQQYHQRQAEQRRHYEPENISINSHNNSYRNAEKTNSKIIFFQREGKQIYYRSPLPRRTPVNKFPRRANLNHHLINPNNNNEKINQSDDYQEHKINTRGLINQEKDSLGQNQPIILYESRKPCQQDQSDDNGKDNYFSIDNNSVQPVVKHVNLDRSDRNDNTYRRKSEICITRMDNFSEIKLLEKNEATSSRNSQYKNHSGDNDKQIKYNKRPLLSYISVYKEEGQQTDILDIENTNSVKREMPIRKPFVKPQDLRSYVHYYDSDNNITGKTDSKTRVNCSLNGYTGKLRIVKHQQQQQQNGNNEIPQQNHSSLTTTSTTNSNNNISNCSTLQDNVPIKPGRINWAYGITVQNANLNILLTTLNKVVDRNCLDYVRINPYCILCTHVKYNHHHQNNQNNNNNNFISVNHDDNQSTKSSSSQLHTLKHCTNDNETVSILKWEIEIVQLPRLQTYGIRFKLIDGDLIQYRIMEKSLTAQCVQIMNSLIT